MDRSILAKLLIEEGYPTHIIDSTICKLEKLQPEIMSIFLSWLKDGKTPEFSVEGYSFSKLTLGWGMKPVGAFLALDWLIREPEKASKAIHRGIR